MAVIHGLGDMAVTHCFNGSLITAGKYSSLLAGLPSFLRLLSPITGNPYLPGYVEYLRSMKGGSKAAAPFHYVATCLDLPADVQVELMDLIRALPTDKQDPELVKNLGFPLDRVGRITLDSLAAARRVATWLADDKAVQEIERRLHQEAPPLDI
jgi:hypothetical protein